MGHAPRNGWKMEKNAGFVKTSVAEISKEVVAQLLATGLIKQPNMKRKRVDWERLLIREYVKKFYATVPHWIREEVGPIPEGADTMLYARTRRWADAIIREPDNMLVIEGKMKCEPAVIGQILNYRDLLPQTPLFYKYRELPVKMRVVTAIISDDVHKLLEAAGIDVEIYKPSNYEEWYEKVILKNANRE